VLLLLDEEVVTKMINQVYRLIFDTISFNKCNVKCKM